MDETLRLVVDAIQAAGGTNEYVRLETSARQANVEGPAQAALVRWANMVMFQAGPLLQGVITALGTRSLPIQSQQQAPGYLQDLIRSLRWTWMTSQIAQAKAVLARLEPQDPGYDQAMRNLFELEDKRRQLGQVH